jgi:hypothetical protein
LDRLVGPNAPLADPPFKSCPSLDLLSACVIFRRRALRSMSVSSGGFCLLNALLSLCCLAMDWNFSAILAREAAVEAVEAEDTGSRGRELLSGGEILGGGAMIFARKEGLFSPLAVAVPRPRLLGLFICTGERGCFRGLRCRRSRDGEGVEDLRSDSRTRKGSWFCAVTAEGEIAAVSDTMRWCRVLTGMRDLAPASDGSLSVLFTTESAAC